MISTLLFSTIIFAGNSYIVPPANPKHYWRYRMHLSLEQLMVETDFNEDLKGLIERSGRD